MKIRHTISSLVAILLFAFILISCNQSTKIIPVDNISLNHTEITLNPGQQFQLTAILSPDKASNKTINYQTSDENIALVSQDGLIIAQNLGTSIITVTSEDGEFEDTCTVLVIPEKYTDYFEIITEDDWHEAVNYIRENGNDRTFTIHLVEDLVLSGLDYNTEPTFGDVIDINITITGTKAVRLRGTGKFLHINTKQNVIIENITIHNYSTPRGFSSGGHLIEIIGENANFEMRGNSLIGGSHDMTAAILLSGKQNTVTMLHDSKIFARYRIHGLHNINITGTDNYFLMKDNANIESNATFFVPGAYTECFVMSGINNKFEMQDNASITGLIHNIRLSGNSIFSLVNGTISSRGSSGRIIVEVDASFIMSGGVISNNKVAFYDPYGPPIYSYGAGVYVAGTFLMSSGEILGNTADFGAGVYVQTTGTFKMSGGIIYGSKESGVPDHLANIANIQYAALAIGDGAIAVYEDGSAILPHVDGDALGTDHTITRK